MIATSFARRRGPEVGMTRLDLVRMSPAAFAAVMAAEIGRMVKDAGIKAE